MPTCSSCGVLVLPCICIAMWWGQVRNTRAYRVLNNSLLVASVSELNGLIDSSGSSRWDCGSVEALVCENISLNSWVSSGVNNLPSHNLGDSRGCGCQQMLCLQNSSIKIWTVSRFELELHLHLATDYHKEDSLQLNVTTQALNNFASLIGGHHHHNRIIILLLDDQSW